MKVKTDELTGYALNWVVNQIEECCDDPRTPLFSTNWSQGGPIIERECIEISCIHTTGWTPDTWTARHPQRFRAKGPTPLIAAMRCFVASRLGDEVEVPEELK